jgi:peptidoglycan/xylan/chitin deacetylase (PgdA/CDA1 family)
MRMPGRKKVVQMQRWLSSRFSDRAVILGYHKIGEVSDDFYEICVSSKHFSEHLGILRRDYHPICLTEMVSHLKNGTLPHKSVAITFDDGYADNLLQAKPLLEHFDIPATIFISPGNLGGEFWWDELERLILTTAKLPESIRSSMDGEILELNTNKTGTRKQLLKMLYERLLMMKAQERDAVLDNLRSWAGDTLKAPPASRLLQPAEIIQLAGGGLIEIGAHTMTHPILPRLPISEQKKEIQDSKDLLEDILGKPVTGFAYPNGSFNQDTEAVVKESGFQYACSSKRDVIWRRQQIYHLPRFWPKDWDGNRMINDMSFWLN